MAVTYDTTTKNNRLTAVRDRIDSGGAAGHIKIRDAGNVVLADITLGYSGTSTATISSGVMTFAGFPRSDTSADASGTAANAIITASDGTTIVSGLTVGTSGTDIVLDTTSITSGQTVTLNSAAITHA